jgi:large subunit ribosomal protein L5
MATRLQEKYQKEVVPALIKDLAIANPMAVPSLEKVNVHMSMGRFKDNQQELEAAFKDMTLITGQKPVYTYSKKAIAGFKVRKGDKIGVKVTLRGPRMWEFVDKLFSIVLPRTRDFQGLPQSGFDKSGNYTFGVPEQVVFLEIDPNKMDKTRSMQITLVAKSRKPEQAKELLSRLGLPLEHA